MLMPMARYQGMFGLFIAAFIFVDIVKAQSQSSCTTLRQRAGVCVPILTCITITQLLEVAPVPLPNSVVHIVRNSHCGTFDNVHHVCCEPHRVNTTKPTVLTTTTTETPLLPKIVVSRSKIGVPAGPNYHPSVESLDTDVQAGMAILEATNCGNSDTDRVANGVEAQLFEYPWMALLVYDDGVDRSLSCGGSLITDQYVLTAAHCIRTGLDKQLVAVRLGEYNTDEAIDCTRTFRRTKCAPPVQEIGIEEAIYHKDYSRVKISNDIGLIRLISKAELLNSVKPICLPVTDASKEVRLDRMIIAGWGRMENGLKASILQKAVVPIKSNDYCQQIHRVIRITDSQLCAGSENEIDTCKGDSGGPTFFATRFNNNVRWIQYGIVSAGSKQCGSNFPGIYVKVTSYLQWIAGNIRA